MDHGTPVAGAAAASLAVPAVGATLAGRPARN
jgi:hypothetical protein